MLYSYATAINYHYPLHLINEEALGLEVQKSYGCASIRAEVR